MAQPIEVQQIPLDKIVSEKQVREQFDEESLDGLAQSFRELGQQEPVHLIPIDDGKYRVLTGERRVRAANRSGQTTVLAIIEQAAVSALDVLLRQLTENIQREDLAPMEKARAIDAIMKESGWNASQVAAKLGLTDGSVSKSLSFLSLPEELQQRIDAGELPPTAAYQLTKVDDVSEQRRLADQVASGELTRDALSGELKARKQGRRNSPRRTRALQITAKLDDRQCVTVRAPALDPNLLVSILDNLLTRAKQARDEGLGFDAMRKRLARPAAATPVVGEAP